MSDDFGLLNPVASTYFDRIAREERLIEDQPRRPRNPKSKVAKKNQDGEPTEDMEQTDDSASSQHIDLRI
jgi:hypothetical protein